jgi:hypothetical protein
MPVNTLNDLTQLLSQIEYDAGVLASIVNDASNTTNSDYQGPLPGTVNTRTGFTVRNVQRVLDDIREQSLLPEIQDDGITIVSNAETINFTGANISVTDVGGIPTISLDPNLITKVNTPNSTELAVWNNSSQIEGVAALIWNGIFLSVDGDMLIRSPEPLLTFGSTDAPNNGPANIHSDLNASLILNADLDNLEINSNILLRVDGSTVVTIDGTGAVVTGDVSADNVIATGDVLASGLVGGLNFRSNGSSAGLAFEIDATLGVADPVDPLGGDPFDTFQSMFDWIEARYLFVKYVYANVAVGTYDLSTTGLVLPGCIEFFEFYGADRLTTILDFGGTREIETGSDQAIAIGICQLTDLNAIWVGGLQLFQTDLITTANNVKIKIDNGIHYYNTGSSINDSSFSFNNLGGGAIEVYGTQLTILGDFIFDVTGAASGVGYVLKANYSFINIAASANIDIQDLFLGSPVDGTILIDAGSTYYQDPLATFTVGNVTIEDNALPLISDLRPGITSVATSRNLALTDVRDILEIDTTSGAIVLTIPTNASEAFPIGTKIEAVLLNVTNSATITAAGTVTLNGVVDGSEVIVAAAYSHVTLYKRGADDWIVYGDVV